MFPTHFCRHVCHTANSRISLAFKLPRLASAVHNSSHSFTTMTAQDCLKNVLIQEEYQQKMYVADMQRAINCCIENLSLTGLTQMKSWKGAVDNERAEVKAIKLDLEKAGYEVLFYTPTSVRCRVFVMKTNPFIASDKPTRIVIETNDDNVN